MWRNAKLSKHKVRSQALNQYLKKATSQPLKMMHWRMYIVYLNISVIQVPYEALLSSHTVHQAPPLNLVIPLTLSCTHLDHCFKTSLLLWLMLIFVCILTLLTMNLDSLKCLKCLKE